MSPDVRWEIPQTLDTIDPASSHYNAKSRYAKTLRRDGESWGDVPTDEAACKRNLAHDNSIHFVPDLPHFVGHFVFRLPPADARQPARPAQQI